MPDSFEHLFISDRLEERNYKTLNTGGAKHRVYKDNHSHGQNLLNNIKRNIADNVQNLPDDYWTYITVNGTDEIIENLKSLENGTYNVKISNIKEVSDNNYNITISVNKKYLSQLFKKINDYINKFNEKSGQPKNQKFLNSLEEIKKSILEDLWIGDTGLIPQDTLKKWCEVWLIDNNFSDFCIKCNELNIQYASNSIQKFIERVVIHIYVDKRDLHALIEQYPKIGEFRPINNLSSFWTELSREEQVAWANNISDRLSINNDTTDVAISILDTGVNNGHPLLNDIIPDNACDSCNSTWNNNDNDGHGTAMCGIAAYGNIKHCLESNEGINIRHSISSVKVLPRDGYVNEEDSYGNITKNAVSRSEIIYPDKKRIHCMAITEKEDANVLGIPSSWSASIDTITSAQNIDEPRQDNNNNKNLFLISAGNYETTSLDYPEANKNTPIISPAQAWNAVTVGAYTNLIHPHKNNLANAKQLSPYSTTSLAWSKTQWPIKPEVLFEGGNKVIDGQNSLQAEETSVLSLDSEFTHRIFTTCSGTSPATAEAANFAAKIYCEYPNMWPETIRALMVHSAEWTPEMEAQFLPTPSQRHKGSYVNILRTCGYGVPNLENALHSGKNSLVLIAENEIQPYKYNSETKKADTNQMHLYQLPWPKDELIALGSAEVELKVTLSYFIEPAPFAMGKIPNSKYRYASYGLRFDVNRFDEIDKEKFVATINKIDKDLANSNGEEIGGRSNSPWLYSDACGINNGSVHCNVWRGTATELANSNLIAVYPVMGWWKDRPYLGCCNKKTRYSLIVSLKTQEIETDIYTPVKNKISIPIVSST